MGTQILVAGGKGVLGSWEARARWVKGLMVVEIAVGLRAKAAVHTCTVCISMWRKLALEGRHDSAELDSLPRISMRACTGLDSSVAASRDSGAGCPVGTACMPYTAWMCKSALHVCSCMHHVDITHCFIAHCFIAATYHGTTLPDSQTATCACSNEHECRKDSRATQPQACPAQLDTGPERSHLDFWAYDIPAELPLQKRCNIGGVHLDGSCFGSCLRVVVIQAAHSAQQPCEEVAVLYASLTQPNAQALCSD